MSSSELSQLLKRLNGVQRLRGTRYRVIFLCTAIGLFGSLFLAFSVVDIAFKLPLTARALASSACLVAMLLAVAKLIRVGLSQRRELRASAQEVERTYPQIDAALSTSVEFGLDKERAERLSSEGIVAALVADTQGRTHALDFFQSINWRRAKAAALWFAVVVAACGFYSVRYTRLAHLTFLRMVGPWRDVPAPTLTLAEVRPRNCEVRKLGDVRISAYLSGKIPPECRLVYRTVDDQAGSPSKWQNEPMTMQDAQLYTFKFSRMMQPAKFRVLAGDFRSDEYTIDVYEVPRVVRINMSLIYPEYCGLGQKELKDSIGPITALRGTVVRIHAFANKPLRRAGIRFSSREPAFVAAELPKPDELAAEFTIHQNDRYKIWLADAQGRVNEDAVFYTIKALDDKKPVVKLKRPKENLKAKKTTEVLVEVDTTDDYGIQEVGIAYKIKTDDLVRVPLDEFRERIKQARSDDTLFLEDMDLADTDIVTYYAYAQDNDTVTGPKLGTSDLHFIEITPYAYRYVKDEKKAGGGKEGDKKEQKFIEKLEDIIKAQRELLSKTFRLDKSLPIKLTQAQVTQIEDLASTQEALHKKADILARRLIENLMKLGLEEHLDRAEHLVRGSNEMGLAAYVLTKGSTATAIRYENTALYHLYRAKRDLVKLIQETKDPKLREKLEQAFSSAGKQQEQQVEQELEREMEDLRNQAKDIEQMRDKQQELNKQMQKMAADKLRKERGDPAPQKDEAPTKPADTAKQQNALAKAAGAKSQRLREMDQQSDKLSAAPARDMDQAAYEMDKAAKAARERKPEEGKERGKEADELMKRAAREIKRAMERSLAQQLKDAAAQAQELAKRQKALGQETQRQAQAQQQGQQPQQQRQQQAKTPGTQKDGQAQAKADERAAQQQTQALARKQDEVRRDLDAVGEKLERLGTQVERTEPEIGREVQKLGQNARKGKAQDEMQKARRELEQERLAAAREPQRQAEKQLDQLAKQTRQAAEQFAMDDEERLAQAIDKADRLAQQQGKLNQDMARVQQYHPTGRKPHEDKAARQQEAVQQETRTLAKQVDRIQTLQEAGMDEQVRKAVEKAADLMAGAKQQLQRQDPKAAERKGTEARKELEQSAKAMRRQMKDALNQKLAKAVEAAKKAHEAQLSAKDQTRNAEARQTESQRPARPSSQHAARPTQATPGRQAAQKAAEDQATAKDQTQRLQKELEDIARQAKKTHQELAKDVDKIGREMESKQPVRRMTQAQRDLERKQYRSAQQHQQAAAKALAQAHGKLNDLYQDSASKPLQTLKAAEREAKELKEQVQQLQKKTRQAATRVGRTPPAKPAQSDPREKELQALQQQQQAAQDKTERFTDRMERLNPTAEDKQKLAELKGKMAEVNSQLGQRQLEQASAGLGTSQKVIQDIGKGIIERIKRIVDERQRKEPSEENTPDEYRELVKRYYQALSAK